MVDGVPIIDFFDKVYGLIDDSMSKTLVMKLLGRKIRYNPCGTKCVHFGSHPNDFNSWISIMTTTWQNLSQSQIIAVCFQRDPGLLMASTSRYNHARHSSCLFKLFQIM